MALSSVLVTCRLHSRDKKCIQNSGKEICWKTVIWKAGKETARKTLKCILGRWILRLAVKDCVHTAMMGFDVGVVTVFVSYVAVVIP